MRLFVVSDPHFASPAEIRIKGWEQRAISNAALRIFARVYRRLLWLADPTGHNHQLDAFIERARPADLVVANGDYSCDSGYVGLCDPAARASAVICLGKLREAFQGRLLETIGDHELGKMSLFGGVGGPRFESWIVCTDELGLPPMWRHDLGRHVLVGVTSSLLALPMFEREILPSQRADWYRLRDRYLQELGGLVAGLPADRPVILFCHDPSALPFLVRESSTRPLLDRIQCTIVGHLHSPLVMGTSRVLAGIPEIRFAGQTTRRLSGALKKARDWMPFNVVLCPSPPGIQLLKDGGYLELTLDESSAAPPAITRHRLPWN